MPDPSIPTPDTIVISREQYRELLGARYLQTWVRENLELGSVDPYWLAGTLRSAYKQSIAYGKDGNPGRLLVKIEAQS